MNCVNLMVAIVLTGYALCYHRVLRNHAVKDYTWVVLTRELRIFVYYDD